MINKKQINDVINTIISKYKPKKIILFGSYATNSAYNNSDIDLLIIKDDNTSKIKRNRIVRSYLSNYDFPIDVIVKTSFEFEKYKDIIGNVSYSANKYGKVVYG